jgi:hypothetical protein
LHPSTQILDLAISPIIQADSLEEAQCALVSWPTGHPLQFRQVDQRVEDLDIAVETSLLRQISDTLFGAPRSLAQDLYATIIGLEYVHDDADRGRLPRAIGPQKAEEFPLLHLKGEMVDGDDVTVPFD